ncbi:MAG: hypothetical protein PHT95_04880 [Candidatus Omnitrophica bacterium]|nr:hypothetical protein [Candidatus Omnitrophota bacterium]
MSATATEQYLISRAVDVALCFGLGIMTTCREELEDKGIEWSDRLEKYVFDTYVEPRHG